MAKGCFATQLAGFERKGLFWKLLIKMGALIVLPVIVILFGHPSEFDIVAWLKISSILTLAYHASEHHPEGATFKFSVMWMGATIGLLAFH
ncbi:MAG: hypothetical protein EXR12_04615 [Rhodospirillaceae bacterium]|nr:hypothetical protein [Rhodospirillaceae bacterium]